MKLWNKSIRLKNWFLTWALVFSLGGSSQAEVLDRVIAKVNNEIITLSEVQDRAAVELNRLRAAGREDIPTAYEIMEKILNRMIENILLLEEGRNLGMSISDKNVLEALDEIKSNNSLTDEELEQVLDAESQTLEEYKDTIRDQILLSKVIRLEIKNRIVVSEKPILKYYEKNKKKYWRPGKVWASHILFILDDKVTESEKKQKEIKAVKVLQKIREGVDFAELAKAYSEDVSAGSGGDLGLIERGKTVAEFEQAVFAMKEGEVSDIVRSTYGLHIIKIDKVSAGRTQPLDEVRDKIISTLRQKKYNENFDRYIANLKKNAFIENRLKLKEKSRPGASKVVKKNTQSLTEKKHEVANILPPLKLNPAGQKTLSETHVSGPAPLDENVESFEGSSDLEILERRLRDIKKMRERDIISEEDYQKRKRELLDGL